VAGVALRAVIGSGSAAAQAAMVVGTSGPSIFNVVARSVNFTQSKSIEAKFAETIRKTVEF